MLLEKVEMMKQLWLVTALEQQDAWKRVAEQFGLTLHLKQSSAHALFITLMNSGKTVEDLISILHELNLDEAASIISEPVRLQIVRQPYCEENEDCFWDDQVLCVHAGGRLHLKIDAVGCPLPSYQWFHDNIPLVSNQELIIPVFSEEMEGLYHCAVQQLEDFSWERRVISEDVTVRLATRVHHGISRISSSFPPESELECGDEFMPTITVSAGPQSTYTWWHNDNLLEGYRSNVLQIRHVNEESAGRYECRVKNDCGESCREFKLTVKRKRPNPTKKIALLIGNCDKSLITPPNDTKMMEKCLKKYGFQCKVFTNLSAAFFKEEVTNYFKTVPEGAFVLFFYGGHGFMANNLKYMVGYNADLDAIKIEDVVNENFVLEDIQEHKPMFIISILDMCQTSTNCDFKEEQNKQDWKCNMIQCYSTSRNRVALEKRGSANSVYTKHLLSVLNNNKYKDQPFVDLIHKVNQLVIEEMPDQVPQIVCTGGKCKEFNLSDPMSLPNQSMS